MEHINKEYLGIPEGTHIVAYDMEVFAHNWLVVAQDVFAPDRIIAIHNNREQLKTLFSRKDILFAGFNSTHYDDIIISALIHGATPQQAKALSDWIVNRCNGKVDKEYGKKLSAWDHPVMKYKKKLVRSLDLMQDMGTGNNVSLKQCMYNLNMNVKESDIPFDIDRPLTQAELEETYKYCLNDVKATTELFHYRHKSLKSKSIIAELMGVPTKDALIFTNAKLTALMLGADTTTKAEVRPNTRTYTPPPNLHLGLYKKLLEIYYNFSKLLDKQVSQATTIKNLECLLGLGGIHGAVPNTTYRSNAEWVIINIDVASYYPTLMLVYSLASRYVESIERYIEIYNMRLKAKREKNKVLDKALKLILNTFYGATKDKYNALFDPDQASAVCITGQLFLVDLMDKLAPIEGLEFIQANTDGIMVYVKREYVDHMKEIVSEWEQRSGMTMEYDVFDLIRQRDVNCYIGVQDNGDIKLKGGFLKYANPDLKEEDHLNRTMPLACTYACIEYLIHETPIMDTLKNNKDIAQFSLFAKAGGSYNGMYQLQADGTYKPIQNRNRVYAITFNGKDKDLYKQNKDTETYEKVKDTPPFALIDNEDAIRLNNEPISLDYNYYLKVCNKFLFTKGNTCNFGE